MRRLILWWLMWLGSGIVLTAAAGIGSHLIAQPSNDAILLLSGLYVAGIALTCSCCLTWYRLWVDARAGILFMLGLYFLGIAEGAVYFSQPHLVVAHLWNLGSLGASVVGMVLVVVGGWRLARAARRATSAGQNSTHG
jgi:hypothetical protein